MLGSAENCCIYTVGQLQPKVEVPAPQSKKLLDDRKLQSKAWALRCTDTQLAHSFPLSLLPLSLLVSVSLSASLFPFLPPLAYLDVLAFIVTF